MEIPVAFGVGRREKKTRRQGDKELSVFGFVPFAPLLRVSPSPPLHVSASFFYLGFATASMWPGGVGPFAAINPPSSRKPSIITS